MKLQWWCLRCRATNQLVEWATTIGAVHDAREYDAIVATGEQVTVGLLTIALQNLGVDARSWPGWQVPIHTDNVHGAAVLVILMRRA